MKRKIFIYSSLIDEQYYPYILVPNVENSRGWVLRLQDLQAFYNWREENKYVKFASQLYWLITTSFRSSSEKDIHNHLVLDVYLKIS